MNILNYCSYIFNLETIIILSKLKFYKESFYINSDNQNITNEMYFQNIYNSIELVLGIQEFFSSLFEEKKIIYIEYIRC
jgi:hypothetical protein